MDDILEQLGWGDGFRIPVANEENKALELEVQKKQKEKENLQSALEDITERVSGMNKHLENVQHQLDQNQNLIFVHKNQKSEEENLVKLARIEDTSLTNDIKKIKKEQEDVCNRQNLLKKDIDQILQHLDKLNATIKWDKDALVAWDEEVSRGEDDAVMLEKFMKEDEAKFKELELKRQYLGSELENKKNRLISLKNDVLSMEQSLEKTAEMFRRQHIDRRNLVQQWERSVRVLHERDEEINRVIEEVGNLKSLAKERLKDLEEQKTFYENEVKNNKELDVEIENVNKQITETKEKIRLIESILTEENHKFTTMKTVLATTTTQYNQEINRKKSILKETEVMENRVIEMREKLESVKKEFEISKSKKITAAERAHKLDSLLKEETKIFEGNLLEFKKLDGLMFQVMQQINELKEGEKSQIFSIKHIETCSLSFKKQIEKRKEELNRQKEVLYNMDFSYMEKNILLNRIMGVIKEEDSDKNKKKVTELEDIQKKVLATNTLLTKEVSRLEEDMRRVTIELEANAKEQNYLRNKRQENLLLLDGGQKQLKALILLNQDLQVDENLLKLRVRQAEKAIDKVGGQVFSLEKQRLQLDEAMKEREIEIKTMRDILNVRRRVLDEQLTNLNSRINLAKVKVDHLKSKFEVAVSKLGKDENGEPLSMTFMKIRSSQEKCELQEMGDKLDSKIKRSEKEIQAMENTLKVVNATNKAFKNNLQSIDPNSPEKMEKKELKDTQFRLVEDFQKRKLILEELNAITVKLEKEYQDKLVTEEAIRSGWNELDQQIVELDKDLKEQEQKLERADKQLKKLIREIRGSNLQKFQTVEEKDIEFRELMEQNEYGLQQLAELVAKTFDTGPIVIRYLKEKGLTLPAIKSPSASVKSASISSVASARSLKSSGSSASRTSSCLLTPSVVTLDSAKLSDKSKSKSETKMPSVEKTGSKKASVMQLREPKKKSDSAFTKK